MKISTKSLKAIEALLEVAVLGARKPVNLATVGRRRNISLSYLEQVFRKLRDAGLVSSTRGPGGGYRLGRGLAAISIADIVNAVDDGLPGYEEAADTGCGKPAGTVSTRHLWCGLNGHLRDYLHSITLASLLDDALVAERALVGARAPAPVAMKTTPQPAAGVRETSRSPA